MARAEEEADERGWAGASARAEYERRRASDESRRRALFGPLAPVVRLIAGPKPSTEAWGRGAAGQERVGHWLDEAVRGAAWCCTPGPPPPWARQHRPPRSGGVGRLGHRHQAFPGPAGADATLGGCASPTLVSSWRAAIRAAW